MRPSVQRRRTAGVYPQAPCAQAQLLSDGSRECLKIATDMTNETAETLKERKAKLRRQAYDARNAQENKDDVSRTIVERFIALPEYAAAKAAMWYLDVRSEVRTRHQLGDALKSGKKIVVPYCTVDDSGANKLGLWHLASLDELVVGKWSIR